MPRWKANLIALLGVWTAHFAAVVPEVWVVARNWPKVSGTDFESQWIRSVALSVPQYVWPFWSSMYSRLEVLTWVAIAASIVFVPFVKALQRDWSLRSGLLPAAIIAASGALGMLAFGESAAAAFGALMLGFIIHGLLINGVSAVVTPARLTSVSSGRRSAVG